LGDTASWWVGTTWMMPFVFVFGVLIARKIQREDMLATFFVVALATIFLFTFLKGGDIYLAIQRSIFTSSLLFFGFIMFSEPLTTPPTKRLQLIYAAIVGVLFAPQIHIGSLYSTPELALVVGNVFSYFVSPKGKLLLTLKEKLSIGTDEMDFIFITSDKISYAPGQYMEWTLPHQQVDSRGNRRYFTLASSPTEDTVRLGVKFYQKGSSFKRALHGVAPQAKIMAGQLAGDFTLPQDTNKKLVFIAGGIGITPFRSMIKYLIDTKQRRDIVVFYSNKLDSERMYTDVFDAAQQMVGIPIVYTLTDESHIPSDWKGEQGRIDAAMIAKHVPDWKERIFYLSGPHAMVVGFEEVLKKMGVSSGNIKKDFFPGFV
jgi:ferredoxin-NADP reductase